MVVVLGNMVHHAGAPAVHIRATQLFGRNNLAGRGLHQWRTAKEDRPLASHDHCLVRHRRYISAARGAAPHHACNLRDSFGGHVCLIVENSPEVVAIGKDIGLVRKIRPAGVDQVNTRQPILSRNILGPNMLFDRRGKVSAALHGRIVGDDHYFFAADAADSGDQARSRRLSIIHLICRQRTDFEKGRAGIEQSVHALARKKFAAREMTLPRGTRSTKSGLSGALVQLSGKSAVMAGVDLKARSVGIDGSAEQAHGTLLGLSRGRSPTVATSRRFGIDLDPHAWTQDRRNGGVSALFGSPRMSLASSGVAGRRPWRSQAATASRTNSALLRAKRSLVIRMLSSRPVRTASAPLASAQSITSIWCRPIPAAVQVAFGR